MIKLLVNAGVLPTEEAVVSTPGRSERISGDNLISA
jgi:hypothetical protein